MPNKVTIYHWSGPADLYTIDARDALQNHADEWRSKEWPEADAAKAASAEAKKSGIEIDKNWSPAELPAKVASAIAEKRSSR